MASFAGLMNLAGCGGGGGSTSTGTAVTPPTATSPPATSTPIPTSGQLSNLSGPCLVIRGESNRVIENLTIGPCQGNGIEILNSINITVRNVTVLDTKDSSVYVNGSTSVHVTESMLADGISGVSAVQSSGIRVTCNSIEDPTGPVPRGQFVQFDKVVGGENLISCNKGINRPGAGAPEDAISLYKSSGTAALPISVSNNLLIGGGPSDSGGGIMLGDDGGEYQVARGNVLVDPGQYGIAVSGGTNLAIQDNRVYARQQAFSNVGIYVWNQYAGPCSAITVSGNQVAWLSKTGSFNGFYNGANCGAITLSNNNYTAPLSSSLTTAAPPAVCTCKAQGWR